MNISTLEYLSVTPPVKRTPYPGVFDICKSSSFIICPVLSWTKGRIPELFQECISLTQNNQLIAPEFFGKQTLS